MLYNRPACSIQLGFSEKSEMLEGIARKRNGEKGEREGEENGRGKEEKRRLQMQVEREIDEDQ